MSTHERGFTVYVVDDDPGMRDSLALMLGLSGYATSVFESAEALLAAWQPDWTGCMVVDLKLPGKDGLQLQAELRARGSRMPFVVMTAHGDVAAARASFRAEAVDFLEKPFEKDELCGAIERGMQMERSRMAHERAGADIGTALAKLTPREREVLAHVGEGLQAKEIAAALKISSRTVEVYKSRLMAKLEARNVSELVRFALRANPD